MIKQDFYATETSDPNSTTQYTKEISNIPITDKNFTNAYWLGWCSPENAPRWVGASEISYDTSKGLIIKDCTSKNNFDVGYMVDVSNEDYPYNLYFLSSDKYGTNPTSGYTNRYLPNRFKVGENSRNWNNIVTNLHYFVFAKNINDTSGEEYSGGSYFSTGGTIKVTLTRDEINNISSKNVTFSVTGNFVTEQITFSLGELSSNQCYLHKVSKDKINPNYSAVDILICCLGSSIVANSGAVPIVPMFRFGFENETTNFSGVCVSNGSGSRFPTQTPIYITINKSTHLSPSNKGLFGTPYISATNANNFKDITQKGAQTTVYGRMEITYSDTEMLHCGFAEGGNCVICNSNNGTSGTLYLTQTITLNDSLKYFGFNVRVAKKELSKIPAADREKVTEDFYYPEVTSANEFTGNLITSNEKNKYRDLQPWQYEDDATELNDYNSTTDKPSYSGGGGSGDEKDKGDLNSVRHSGAYVAGVKYYVLNSSMLNAFTKFVNVQYRSDATKDIADVDFRGLNPFEYVTSLMYFPWDVPHFVSTSNLLIGPVDTHVTPQTFINTYGYTQNIIDFGSNQIVREFNDFRDFAPYTKMSLNVPFCSTIDIDPKTWYNHTMSIEMNVDYTTGACSAFVYRDNLIVEMINGQCGYSLPILLTDMGGFQNNIAQNRIAQKQNNFTGLAGVGSSIGAITVGAFSKNAAAIAGGVGGLISSAESWAQQSNNLDYQYTHSLPNAGTIGATSPIIDACGDWYPRLLIYRPKSIQFDTKIYSDTVGNACFKTGRVSDFTGFTQFTNVILNSNATVDEKSAILTALQNGIII